MPSAAICKEEAVGFGPAGWACDAGQVEPVPDGASMANRGRASPMSERGSPDGEGDSCADAEAVMKDFVAALGAYFRPEGGAGGAVEELRLNANALGSRRGPPSSSSQFRGVTRHRRTKKWESHIWYNKKQLYLGGFKEAMDAAKAHDIMGLKLRGSKAHTNFEPSGYLRLGPFLDTLSMDQVIDALRMVSKGADFGTAMKKSVRASRAAKHQNQQQHNLIDAFVSSGDEDGTLVPIAGHIADNIQAMLLPPIWTGREHLREGATMEDLSSTVIMSPTLGTSKVADLLSSCPLEPASSALIDDAMDATWAPIMCANDIPLFPELGIHASPFGQYSQAIELEQTEQRVQSELRSDLDLMCGQSPGEVMGGTVVPLGQRAASEPLPEVDEGTYGWQDLSQPVQFGRQHSMHVVDHSASGQACPQHESVIVKVPVYQSKVVQYPGGAARAASMPVPTAGSVAAEQTYLYANQGGGSDAYTTLSSRSSASAMDAYGRSQAADIVQFPSLNVQYADDFGDGMQVSDAMVGMYSAEQFGLDSRASGATGLSSSGSGDASGRCL
ncbi:unnamed protein product [Ostreobium quekettii]|uniref:AP2/ERF domain-containing protein n=1 Tax=Ostreobium quekettii TaxID=121088 RepID=A0A8S1JH41_9CHLO|nr:unnamed protein product [Ostreobium quekettii]